MAILKNARHERFAQNLAKGMSATAAYEKAGYKPNDQNAARLTRNDEIRSRVAELMAPAIEATEATLPQCNILARTHPAGETILRCGPSVSDGAASSVCEASDGGSKIG